MLSNDKKIFVTRYIGTYIPCNSVQFPNSEGIVP